MRHPKADEEKRRIFLEQLNLFKQAGRPIVYLDESGFKSHENRPYGYSARGTPCFSEYNWQLKNQTNAIGALFEKKLFAVGLYDSSINGDAFYDWAEQLLLPDLEENSVIVMDNATFHKRSDIKELIENSGHTILYLPPYSPDLNPIEQTWAWVKKKCKEWNLNCVDQLFFYFLWIYDCFNSF